MAYLLDDTLHLSIDHLPEGDLELLTDRGRETSMIGASLDGEVMLSVDFYGDEHDPHGKASDQLREDGYSDEFIVMVRWAAARGARTVRLDAEGAVVEDLALTSRGPNPR